MQNENETLAPRGLVAPFPYIFVFHFSPPLYVCLSYENIYNYILLMDKESVYSSVFAKKKVK